MISQRTTFFPFLDHETSQLTQSTICTMEGHRRRLSIDPASIESILTSGVASQAAAPPSPHVGNSPNRAYFAMDPPPLPAPKHSRASSYTPRRPNRLSLSFPVATGRNSNDSTRPTPTSSTAPSFPPTPAEIIPSPNDPSGFLNALACQERRVLELKEELEKAEVDLTKLKRQWAVHEAHKKRSEIRHVEQMQPLQTATAEGAKSNEEGITMTRQSAELDRRKALLSNINTKESRRKVITGGHTRTLSLLSPERSNYPRPFPPVREASSETQSAFPRTTIMPDTSIGITRVGSHRARPLSYHGGITHGAKQVAEDVKAGLWTFLEDLRQATVGDEAVNGTVNRAGLEHASKGPSRKGSKSSLLGADKGRSQKGNGNSQTQSPRAVSPRTWDSLTGGNNALLDAADSMWPESRISTKALTPAKKSRTVSLAAPALEDDDDWSNWDSPTPKSPRWSGSTTLSEDPATPSNASMDDRAVKILGQSSAGSTSTPSRREELQWPALDKLTPGNLKRTVSTIMQEWEKSLTPPPEEGHNPLDNGGKETRERTQEEEALLMSR